MRLSRIRITSALAIVVIIAGGATLIHRSVVTRKGEAAVSFDILFHTCNLGTREFQARNPFTGAVMTTVDDPGLTIDERAMVVQLIHRLGAEGPDTHDFYRFRFPDGGEAELFAPHLTGEVKCDGLSVGTSGLTADVLDFLFRLSVAGNMMILPAAEGVGSLVTSEGQRQRVTSRYPDAKLIRSAAALGGEMRHGFELSKRYTDQVVNEA